MAPEGNDDKHKSSSSAASPVRTESRRSERTRYEDVLPHIKDYPSPRRLIIVIVAAIFIAESAVMAFFTLIPPLTLGMELLLDATLLVLLVILPLYLLFMKPMERHIVERKSLEKKLHALSLTDELTGLYNRRALFAFAEHEMELAKREDEGICLLYADLDNLKEINDTLGHNEGDRVLINIARILKETYRQSDIVARLGGDEFVVIPVGSTREGVDLVRERIHRHIENHNTSETGGRPLSISTGVAYRETGSPCSIDDLIIQADRMMYEHKARKKTTH